MADSVGAQGDYARATELLREALALSQKRNGTPDRWIFPRLARASWAQGDYGQADMCWREALEGNRAVGDRENAAYPLEGMAALTVVHGRPEDAARLLGAASALPDLPLTRNLPVDRAIYERALSSRERIDERTWSAAWEEGRALSLDEAVEYALGLPEVSVTPAVASPARTPPS